MRQTDFNNFMENLKGDLQTYECFGFAFLRMTDKQLVKCCEFYKSICMLKEENNRIHFGSHFQFSIPTDIYKN